MAKLDQKHVVHLLMRNCLDSADMMDQMGIGHSTWQRQCP